VSASTEEERKSAAIDLEYAVAFHASHLYDRKGLRSVVWRFSKGDFLLGRYAGAWERSAPRLGNARKHLLEQRPLLHFEDVWVDDPSKPIHQDSVQLGSGSAEFPSFVLASLVAGNRNLGLLQVDAPEDDPLVAEDVRPIGLMAAILAAAWAFVDPVLGVDQSDE